jgi:Na+/H+ antiporter NhaC
LELIRKNGGITFLIHWLTRRVRNSCGAEFSIGTLVGLTNLCTANNTIAILSVGEISRNIAERYGVDTKRSASLLDTCSCIVQGFIPYGAQLLMAAGLASISPVEIIPHLFYPMLLVIAVASSIIFRIPRMV